jgi:hypothetical protein
MRSYFANGAAAPSVGVNHDGRQRGWLSALLAGWRPMLTSRMAPRALALLLGLFAVALVQQWRHPDILLGADAPAMALADDSATLPMPFERAGDSFPGSAYYYVAPDSQPAKAEATWQNPLAGLMGSADSTNRLSADAGTAHAVTLRGTGLDRDRALSCLTAAIYYEAASEPDDGQRAVAQVVLNRMAHPSFPKTVCGVVYQGSERATGCQFTFTCDGALARKPARYFWQRAETVARAALAGYVFAPVGLATHYHTFAVHPYWADKLNFLGQIGAHRFYRFVGPAGAAKAFSYAYAGGEPDTTQRATAKASGTTLALADDPLAQERAYEARLRTANSDAAPHAQHAADSSYTAPSYTSELQKRGGDAQYRATNLPGTESSIRPEYRNSGQWVGDPR